MNLVTKLVRLSSTNTQNLVDKNTQEFWIDLSFLNALELGWRAEVLSHCQMS